MVGTCNSLTRMGEIGLTMTRSERFDASFFIDVPSLESRLKMLERWLTGKVENVEQVAMEIADRTEKFSGADVRSVVKQAVSRADYDGAPLTAELLRDEWIHGRRCAPTPSTTSSTGCAGGDACIASQTGESVR